MYESIKSRVKSNNELSDDFTCCLGIRQGECLSPFLFAMYVNDIEEYFYLRGAEGVDIYIFKLFRLLYAGDITILQKHLMVSRKYYIFCKIIVQDGNSQSIHKYPKL